MVTLHEGHSDDGFRDEEIHRGFQTRGGASGSELFGVSSSGYYAWKGRNPSRRQLDDMVLRAHIRSQFRLSHETYGSPRMTVELREDGIAVGRHRVARLMRENDLKALQKRRFKKTTDSAHGGPVAPNVLDQDFAADGPDQKWGGHFLYLDGGRLAESGGCRRPVLPSHRRLGHQRPHEEGFGADRPETGLGHASTTVGADPSFRPGGANIARATTESSWPTTRSSLP